MGFLKISWANGEQKSYKTILKQNTGLSYPSVPKIWHLKNNFKNKIGMYLTQQEILKNNLRIDFKKKITWKCFIF